MTAQAHSKYRVAASEINALAGKLTHAVGKA